jgi:hypothetical protein
LNRYREVGQYLGEAGTMSGMERYLYSTTIMVLLHHGWKSGEVHESYQPIRFIGKLAMETLEN